MPRKPDPTLEKSIVEATVRLLERGGNNAITMRAVAKAAKTTTPTLYERFSDRDALLDAVTDLLRNRLIDSLDPEDSLEEAGRKFLAFCRRNPHVIELLLKRIAVNLKSKQKGPVYELVRSNLIKQNGFSDKEAEEMTMATSSLMAGTAMLVNMLGPDTPAAKDLERGTLNVMRRWEGLGAK